MEIESTSDAADDEYAERAQFEERYYSLLARARKALAVCSAERARSEAGSDAGSKSGASFKNNFVRLPKIDLPHFNGSYEYWLEFRDTFCSLIHNSDCIDDINKFHYLRASLEGQASEIIKNIDFKGDNYAMAWDLLCERYNNSRLLVNNHVQALFDVETLTKESSLLLRQLIDTVNKNIRALKTLKEPTEHWDTLIIFMISRKLDFTTSRHWEEYRNTLSGSPTLTQFCTFISNRADLLETLENNQAKLNTQNNNTKQKSFIVTNIGEHTSNNNLQNKNLQNNNLQNNTYLLNHDYKRQKNLKSV
ncbi:uncharacterized protein LOC135086442 isoform X2 [Ostrinia nubilalis]